MVKSWTHTRRPGESSVYSLSIVLLDPPAPAARDEFGLATVLPVARRLMSWHKSALSVREK